MIFVFGSNLAGIHGAGAAAYAYKWHGAVPYLGAGPMGNSYAIPTKDRNVKDSLPLSVVRRYVDQFVVYAIENPKKTFQVTRIGCGLAGFKDEEIAPLFVDAPRNCFFDDVWQPIIPGRSYWGTF